MTAEHDSRRRASANAVVGATNASSRPQFKSGSSNPNMNGPLYMQRAGSNIVLIRRLKRKDEGTWKALARWLVENQVGLSFNLLALLFLAHSFIPKARTYTRKFFNLGYHNPNTNHYGVGFDDIYLITFCIVLFTGLRAGTMEYILAPFAKKQGVSKRKDLAHFSEQAWLLTYYCVFWPMGVYIYCKSPYFLNMKEMWIHWPTRETTGLLKGYILAQCAFWLQQIILITIEERRKDHWQMLSHHIITAVLISSCYCYHYTPVGNVILVLMDVVGLFLPIAKCLKYCGFTKSCNIVFGSFVVLWFASRHVFYLMVCWSVYTHAPEAIPTACFRGPNNTLTGPEDPPPGWVYLLDPFLNSTGRVCFDAKVKWAFLCTLLLLQVIAIVWFIMIIRMAIGVIRGDGAENSRSDDEGEEEEEEEEEEDEFIYAEAQLLEEDVGVEELDLDSWKRRSGMRKQASSSGVSLPGHSDRKELLGRIGCEKQVE